MQSGHRIAVFAAVFAGMVSGLVSGVLSGAREAAAGDYGVLHEAEGVDLTYAYCAGCHSERLVAQQGLSRERWEELLVWMVEEQGMVEIEEPDRTIILDYLAEHYNTDRPHFPR